MPRRLIQTDYIYRAAFDGYRENRGSYLGRKTASVRTIRRFLNDNARRHGLPSGVRSVTIVGAHETQWIAK